MRGPQRFLVYPVLAVLSLVWSGHAAAQEKRQAGPRVNVLRGRVVRKSDGKPVGGAWVAMAHARQAHMSVRGLPHAYGPTKRILFFFPRTNGETACMDVADEEGRFEFRHFCSRTDRYVVAAGAEEVGVALLADVRPADYEDRELVIEIPEPAFVALPALSREERGDRSQMCFIEAYKPPAKSTGEDASEPFAGVRLQAKAWPKNTTGWLSPDLSERMAVRAGPLLPDYPYQVRFSRICRELGYWATVYSEVIVVPSGKTVPILRPSEGGVEISGQVVSTDGKPLGFVNVMIEVAGERPWLMGALCDKDGRFRLAHIPPGKHKLRLLRHAVRTGPG